MAKNIEAASSASTQTESTEAQARRYGWTDFQDSDDAALLVVANDNRSVHFTGPNAWAEALAWDKDNGFNLSDQEALDAIAQAMSASEWNADLWDIVAQRVRATGRVIRDIDDLEDDDQDEPEED